MDQRTLKAARDDALRRITNTAGLLSPIDQAVLNEKLEQLVEFILEKREKK